VEIFSRGSSGESWIEAFLTGFEPRLSEAVEGLGLIHGLSEAAHYVLSQKGKRIRPLLGFALWADLSNEKPDVEGSSCLCKAMISLELLHNSSLVHDDLPALDNDDVRRGVPSCHKKFGEARAILLADALIAGAFGHAARIEDRETTVKVLRALSEAFVSLCNGQEQDMRADRAGVDILELYRLKTGALFASCCEISALMTRFGDSSLNEAAKAIGLGIGEWFQLCDDYLDSFCSRGRKGRGESSDLRNNKQTFFVAKAFSIEQAKAKIDNDFNCLCQQLSGLSDSKMAYTRQVLSLVRSRVIA
jgi:geranylgeranyl pyrophosphate synthase